MQAIYNELDACKDHFPMIFVATVLVYIKRTRCLLTTITTYRVTSHDNGYMFSSRYSPNWIFHAAKQIKETSDYSQNLLFYVFDSLKAFNDLLVDLHIFSLKT